MSTATQALPARPAAARLVAAARSHPFAAIGFTILAAYLMLGLIGPFLVTDPLATDPAHTLAGPSATHWFGTDTYGRDVFARAVYASRLDVVLGLSISTSAMVVGSAIGVLAGFFGGRIDEIVMRCVDIVLAFPGFILAMILVVAIGESVPKVALAVAIAFVPQVVRLTRASVLSERELEYVDGARLAGNGPWRIAGIPNSRLRSRARLGSSAGSYAAAPIVRASAAPE